MRTILYLKVWDFFVLVWFFILQRRRILLLFY